MYQHDSNGCPSQLDSSCRVEIKDSCQELSDQRYAINRVNTGYYRNSGMTRYTPDINLRLPQRRDFLTPKYFNGGCNQPYCDNKASCPYETEAITPASQQLLWNWRMTDPFDNVPIPISCQKYS